jgi:fatty-acyl-CoA synthase
VKGPLLPPPRHATISEAFAAAAAGPSGLTFVDLDEDESFVPFSVIHRRARRTAAALREAGVAPTDRVAIVLPTSPAFGDAFFGVLAAGAVPVPLYPPVRLGRLAEYHAGTARMLTAVEARLVLADDRTCKLLGQAIERARPELGWRNAETLADGAPELEVAVEQDSLALIQFSSGSTADPKPVALSHRQLMAQLSALHALLPVESGHRQLGVSWLPLYHDMGLIGCLLLAVYYPGPLVLIPPEHFLARPALWLRAIARHRATLSVSPAFGFALAARRVRAAELVGVDLSSWRLAVCGAEPVSMEALRAFQERFGPCGFDPRALRPVYGLAEAALGVTFAPAGQGPKAIAVDPRRLAATGEVVPGKRSIVSVGTPVPGFEVEVRGVGGRPLPEGRVGRIQARGPSIMAGYFRQPEATSAALGDGWLDTGDLGFVADGELYVCGRDKDLIVIRGANHVPQEFEECLTGLPGLREGCSVAVGFMPEGEDAEQLLVLAERVRGSKRGTRDTDTIDLIRRTILERTGIRPHTVCLLAPGTLPRTSSGKMRRSEVLRRFLAGSLAPPRSAGPARLSAELLRSALALARLKRERGRRC